MCLHSSPRDYSLLDELGRGGADAFWTLWQQHEPRLRAICCRYMSGDPFDTEDALSRAMLVAWAKLPERAREIVNVEAWLTRLASNVCLDIRKERRRGTRRVERLDDDVLTRCAAYVATPPTPEESCVAADTVELIVSSIESLPRPHRDAAYLRFVLEEDYPQIADRLGITEPNARKRVQTARTLLTEKLLPALIGDIETPRKVVASPPAG